MPGYGSDLDFAAWAAGAGYAVPAGAVAAARQRGSAYIDGVYGARFPGIPTDGAEQEREWPRIGATDRYGNALDPAVVPMRVVYASYEAALLELASPGSLSVTTGGTIGVAAVKREKVGPLETEYAVNDTAASGIAAAPVSSAIEGLLGPFLIVPMPVAWVV